MVFCIREPSLNPRINHLLIQDYSRHLSHVETFWYDASALPLPFDGAFAVLIQFFQLIIHRRAVLRPIVFPLRRVIDVQRCSDESPNRTSAGLSSALKTVPGRVALT